MRSLVGHVSYWSLLSLGQTLAAPGTLESFTRTGTSPLPLLPRHQTDDVDAEDKGAHDLDLIHGGRLLSSYHMCDGTKVWCITEADRSATTLLLADKYKRRN